MREERVLLIFNNSPIVTAPLKSSESREKKEMTQQSHFVYQHLRTNVTRIPLISKLVMAVLVVIKSARLSELRVHSEIIITIININHEYICAHITHPPTHTHTHTHRHTHPYLPCKYSSHSEG